MPSEFCPALHECKRLERDRMAFLPLPPSAYDACDKRPGCVNSLSLVRYKGNDYWVPVAYAGPQSDR